MSNPADTAGPAERMLGELAELDLALARRTHAAAMAAEAPEAVADLTRAYHRVARSLRQTLALKARFERERLKAGDDAEAEAGRRRAACVEVRKAQARLRVERALWTEYESENKAEQMACRLDDLISEDALGEGFLDEPLEAYVARLRRDLGLAPRDERTGPRGLYRRTRRPVPRPEISPDLAAFLLRRPNTS